MLLPGDLLNNMSSLQNANIGCKVLWEMTTRTRLLEEPAAFWKAVLGASLQQPWTGHRAGFCPKKCTQFLREAEMGAAASDSLSL